MGVKGTAQSPIKFTVSLEWCSMKTSAYAKKSPSGPAFDGLKYFYFCFFTVTSGKVKHP